MACADCGQASGVLVQMSGTPGLGPPREKDRDKDWELCGRCWIEGRQPFKLGRLRKRPPAKLPEPGTLAGKSLKTGERYVYTDKVIDLSTGEQRPRDASLP